MPVTSSAPAPYAPSKAITDIVERYRSKGLPPPINAEVLARAGTPDSLIPRTLHALQTLDLIDEQGSPTKTFEGLRLATQQEYPTRFAQWLSAAYADVLKFVDPADGDETAVRDAFRSYNPIGQQPRMVSLFMGLFRHAGIGSDKPSPVRQSRTIRGLSSGGNGSSSSRQSSRAANRGNDRNPPPPPPPPPHPPPGEDLTKSKPLNYQLLDLLNRSGIGEAEKNAIWVLLQFLGANQEPSVGS